ncbi:MAG: DNA repair protein RecO [Anaerolineales bacterium]
MERGRSIRVEAVILRHSDWGEADRLLVIYTREVGKLRVVAKGVRRLRSRKAGHLEPFTRSVLMLARGRDFWIVTQAQTLDAYLPLREDLLRTGYAAYVVELVDRFSYDEEASPILYQLLTETLERICTEEDPIPALRYYDVRLLDVIGFRPRLFHCVGCGSQIIAQDQFFSAVLGGALCPNCTKRDAGARPVSMRALKYLRHYQRSTYAEARRVGLPTAVRSELEALLQYYLTFLLERNLNVPSFIRSIRKQNG